jgi:hypothetical protein
MKPYIILFYSVVSYCFPQGLSLLLVQYVDVVVVDRITRRLQKAWLYELAATLLSYCQNYTVQHTVKTLIQAEAKGKMVIVREGGKMAIFLFQNSNDPCIIY